MEYDVESAVDQVAKCEFECVAGPLSNNAAWMWLQDRFKEGPKYYPGQEVWYEVEFANQAIGTSVKQFRKFWVCGVSMSSTSEKRTWIYSITHDRPAAYHCGARPISSVNENKIHATKPE